MTTAGYVRIWKPSHPLANKDGNILVHRMVYFDYYGSIPEGHHIHHKDGNKKNNAIENLEAITNSEHHKEHHPTGAKMRNQYGECKVKALEQRISYRRMKKFIPRTCEQCSTSFVMKRSDAKYCSERCRNRMNTMRAAERRRAS